MTLRTILLGLLLSVAAAGVAMGEAAAAQATKEGSKESTKESERLDDARQVFQEIHSMSDAKIPRPLLEDCRCVAVIPGVVKGALGFGARHGRGVLSCRDASGRWSPPIFLTLSGGSFGFQIGVEKADVVLFFMSDRGARSLLESKFTLGGKGSVAAGPVGRTAEADTDLKLNAEIYSYAKSKGLFAGISLEGARLAPDEKAVRRFYGSEVTPEQVLFGPERPAPPPPARAFVQALPQPGR